MLKIILRPKAKTDVESIWNYSYDIWGVKHAEVYVLKIKSKIDDLSHNPLIGRSCSEIRVGYYKITIESHVIFYKIFKSKIEIVRILHVRMDFTSHL